MFLYRGRVENMIHIVHNAFWLLLKNMHVKHLKFTKTPPPPKKNQAGGASFKVCMYTFVFVEISLYTSNWEDAAFSALMVTSQHVMLNATTVTRDIWQEVISEFQWYSHLFVEHKCHILYRLASVLVLTWTPTRKVNALPTAPSLPLSNLFKMKNL